MKIRRKQRFAEESTFDLNLAPMMDMMVTIIPFLLLSAAFVSMVVIEVPLPQAVANAIEKDRKNEKPEATVALNVAKSGDAILTVTSPQGKAQKIEIKAQNGKADTDLLHKKLVEVKQQYPEIFKLELNPEDGVDYKSIVAVMDASRRMEKQDPKVYIMDPVKKEKAEVPLLFPDVVLANLIGN